MNKKRSGAGSAVISKLGVFVIVCVIVMAVTAFFTYKLAVGSFSDREALNNAKRYAEIEKAVEENYIGNADKETMRSAASSAMIRALGDKWSYYMTPDEYASFKMSGAGGFAGIGMGIFVNSDGRFEISSVEAASVAGKAGLTAGQVIVSVDGQDVSGMSLSGLQTLIRSKMNVNFSIVAAEKNGDEVSATLKCADSYTSPVVYKMLKEDVGYVRIKNFEAGCGDDFKTAVEFLISSGAVSFIFDVRDNPGGLFEEMTKALDLLLPDGTLYSTEDRDGNRATVSSDKVCLKYKMAVLINENSYSAAEFFAVTLQEYNWATVVGTQTGGKSRTQVTVELSDGGALHISTLKYLSSKGVDLAEAGGVTPNVIAATDPEGKSDTQLAAALEAIKTLR